MIITRLKRRLMLSSFSFSLSLSLSLSPSLSLSNASPALETGTNGGTSHRVQKKKNIALLADEMMSPVNFVVV